MNKSRCLAVAVTLILLASPLFPVSAQAGFTLTNGSISSPLFSMESTLYSKLVIESYYDKNTGTYLLNGQVNDTYSSADFSGAYDPATRQINGQYFVSMSQSYDEKGADQYTLSGAFSGSIGNSDSVTLTLSGTILYEKWNFELDEEGNPVWEDYLEETDSSADNRQATFTVTGEIPPVVVPDGGAEDEGSPTAEPAGVACSPQPRGLDPAKPGDVISPGASYVDASGKEVGIIQERWFLNGTNTSSLVWDGRPVQVELQYTCTDHSAGSITYTIPAYQEQPASLPPDNQTSADSQPGPTGGISPLGVAAIVVAILGALTAAAVGIGVGVTYAIKAGRKVPAASAPPARAPRPTAPAAPAKAPPPPASVTPAETAPVELPVQSASPTEPEPVESPPSHPPRLTPEEKARLSGMRDEMQAEIDQIKNRWKRTRDAAEKLKTLKKKNMLKFLMKQGFEVNDWIVNSPVEVINQVTLDPVMEEVFEKHDTSQDGNIIVQIHNRIESLEAEMQQMTDEVRYLQTEINKVNQALAEPGG